MRRFVLKGKEVVLEPNESAWTRWMMINCLCIHTDCYANHTSNVTTMFIGAEDDDTAESPMVFRTLLKKHGGAIMAERFSSTFEEAMMQHMQFIGDAL
jgi:hypothetical protein